MLKNAFATEPALVLDELEAELILTQHIQGGLCFEETDDLGKLLQGASIPASLVKDTVSLCFQRDDAVHKSLSQIVCHAFVPETLLCVLPR